MPAYSWPTMTQKPKLSTLPDVRVEPNVSIDELRKLLCGHAVSIAIDLYWFLRALKEVKADLVYIFVMSNDMGGEY